MRAMIRLLFLPLILLAACSPQQNLASACGYGDGEACAALRDGRTLPTVRPGAFVPDFHLDDHD